jgi:hypothetical protein
LHIVGFEKNPSFLSSMKLDGASPAYRINKTSKYVDAGHGVIIDESSKDSYSW